MGSWTPALQSSALRLVSSLSTGKSASSYFARIWARATYGSRPTANANRARRPRTPRVVNCEKRPALSQLS
jgi:hypothetical protein